MVQLQRVTIAPSQLSNETLYLTPEQHHYLSRVLRLGAGDRFIAMDGQGHGWLSALGSTLREAKILEPIAAQTELPVSVTLLIALPKTGMEDIVRQVTELGVEQIVPVLSQRTLLNPSVQKRDRWQRIAAEAAEQSERQIVPRIWEPTPWAEALKTWNNGSCYLCAERGARSPLLSTLQQTTASSLILATGCEGGWTPAEVEMAIAAAYQPISLGSRILRAVTAPVVVMAIVASVYEAMPPIGKTV
ncbi:16S rRNA (uracil(1498)-N(3))-methyltransferase [Phormidium tenue FACHB-886]|nr:16S rRNA (uracil(1498)-N(3))-methyltransferase [Phormidium tenue FACHB-886]